MQPERRASLIYLVTALVAFGIPFFQNFLVADQLGKADFDGFVFFISVFQLAATFYGFGLGTVIQRYYFDKNASRQSVVSDCFWFWSICSAVLLSLFAFAAYICYSNGIEFDLLTLPELLVTLVSSVFWSFILVFPMVYIVIEKPMSYALQLIGSRLIMFMGVLYVVYFTNQQAGDFVQVYAITSVIVFVLSLLIIGVFPLQTISVSRLREIFYFSGPLMLNSLGGLGYNHGYKVIVAGMLAESQLGILHMATTFASGYYLVGSSVLRGFVPRVYKALRSSDGNPSSIVFYEKTIAVVALGCIILFFPFSYAVLYFFKDGAFLASFDLLPILIIGQVVLLFYGARNLMVNYIKDTYILTAAILTGLTINLATLYLFVQPGKLWQFAVPLSLAYIAQYAVIHLLLRNKNKTLW